MSETIATYTSRQQQRPWTPDELATLRTRYTTDGPTRLAPELQRTRESVRKRAAALGLPTPRQTVITPPPGTFAERLLTARHRAGLSTPVLAARAGINCSYISRMESGDRDSPTREVTLALARGMRLSARETDEFMALAGYLPPSLEKLGPDSTVTAVVQTLVDERISLEARANLRAIIEVMCSQWASTTNGKAKP